MTDVEILSEKSLVLVFAYAPAGLGHLRVTYALYRGLPEDVTPLLLGADDKMISGFYRLICTHTITRSIMEWIQHGFPQRLFTYCYVTYSRNHTDSLYQQMITLINQRIDQPRTILLIATYASLAHQLAVIKDRLTKEKNVQVKLIVQITDDSPQPMWYVKGAGLTFTPSEYTKEKLLEYGKQRGKDKLNFIVSPYPVSPLLALSLTSDEFERKKHQVSPLHSAQTHLVIPISGAATGTQFYTTLIDTLHRKSERFVFHVISKSAPFTTRFLAQMLVRPFVKLHTALYDRVIVDFYEKEYDQEVISLEVTKPSEQAFKALLTPRERGGPILLFANPVGIQEYHNLNFLRRHHLVPLLSEHHALWEYAKNNHQLTDSTWLTNARKWRGLLLPEDPVLSAQFIEWCLMQGIFEAMMHYQQEESQEIASDGVKKFWKIVGEFLKDQHLA